MKNKEIKMSYPTVNPVINFFRRICGKSIPKFQVHTILSADKVQYICNSRKVVKNILRHEYERELRRKYLIDEEHGDVHIGDSK